MDADWFSRRTWQEPAWTPADLMRVKGSQTVSVVLPALNEEATVGGVVASVRPLLGSVVDELIVLDSGSEDATVQRAAQAGARVVHREDVLPDWKPLPGKGEVLWRSLAATESDVIVFLDSDLIEPDPTFVPCLLGPLLHDPSVELVKGFYRRPLRLETDEAVADGGRVTELLARPLLSALRPGLSALVQPLGGEYAARRRLLESLPIRVGYGVEIGLLLDTEARHGMDALAQVNLGVRKHRNRSLRRLGVMAREILSVTLSRCGIADPGAPELTQFVHALGQWLPETTAVPVIDRPPMREANDAAR